jgi:cytidine deaminase
MPTNEERDRLIQTAVDVRKWAYAPYSGYQVGAALLSKSGRIYEGVNVENAAYPMTICAERAAVFSAVADGERAFDAIAVATSNGGSPCGACRQVLAEFGLETVVYLVDAEGCLVGEMTVADLLPDAFRPSDLEK